MGRREHKPVVNLYYSAENRHRTRNIAISASVITALITAFVTLGSSLISSVFDKNPGSGKQLDQTPASEVTAPSRTATPTASPSLTPTRSVPVAMDAAQAAVDSYFGLLSRGQIDQAYTTHRRIRPPEGERRFWNGVESITLVDIRPNDSTAGRFDMAVRYLLRTGKSSLELVRYHFEHKDGKVVIKGSEWVKVCRPDCFA